jgi:OPT family oligopeptide transporter
LLLGTGLLIGPRNGLSLLAGALVGWGGLAPLSIRLGLVPRAEFPLLSAWLLWPGVGLMTSAALTSLALHWKAFGRGVRDLAQLRFGEARTRGPWIWALPIAAIGLVVILGRSVFGLHPLLTLLALALSVILATVAARATGETDIAPITQMGQLTQIFIGAVAPGQVAVNVLSGSVVAADATQTSQTLWSLKTGHLLGADRRRQLWAQWIGVLAGAVVVVPAYELVSRAYGLGSESLPAPTALSWKGLAELVHLGVAGLPPGVRGFTLSAIVLGAVLALLDQSPLSRFLPSAVAMGVGFLAPASYAVTIAAGSIILALARAWRPGWSEGYAAPIASGAIAGESLLGVLIAILLATGVMKPP